MAASCSRSISRRSRGRAGERASRSTIRSVAATCSIRRSPRPARCWSRRSSIRSSRRCHRRSMSARPRTSPSRSCAESPTGAGSRSPYSPIACASWSSVSPGPRGLGGDAGALALELARAVRGEVDFGAGARALYATDASNYRQVPIGVVCPRDAADVEQTLALCRRFGAPALARGGGTSLAGQCCNVAVVLDFSRHMNRVLAIDPQLRVARVEPGCVLDDLRAAAAPHGLSFGPDPATHDRCTLGGMIGNDSCGTHSVFTGRTSDNVRELDVLLADGTRMRASALDERAFEQALARGGRAAELLA